MGKCACIQQKRSKLKLVNIIRYDIEQMDAPFSSWRPLLEEVGYQQKYQQK